MSATTTTASARTGDRMFDGIVQDLMAVEQDLGQSAPGMSGTQLEARYREGLDMVQ